MFNLISIFYLPSFGVKHSLRFVRSKGVVLPDHLTFSCDTTVSITKNTITHAFTYSIINTECHASPNLLSNTSIGSSLRVVPPLLQQLCVVHSYFCTIM